MEKAARAEPEVKAVPAAEAVAIRQSDMQDTAETEARAVTVELPEMRIGLPLQTIKAKYIQKSVSLGSEACTDTEEHAESPVIKTRQKSTGKRVLSEVMALLEVS